MSGPQKNVFEPHIEPKTAHKGPKSQKENLKNKWKSN